MTDPTVAIDLTDRGGPLDPEAIELADLALALEDHSLDHSWWLHRSSGAAVLHFDETPPEIGDAVYVQPHPSSVGYGDMEDFVALVRDPRAKHMLKRSIVGRGAFRRFKDTLLDYPELRPAWFSFHDTRGERRAIEWLQSHGLVTPEDGAAAIALRPDPGPGELPGMLDGQGVAHHVAHDLRRLYRDRLRRVMLTGPWARGDADPESSIDLIVVLDAVDDRWLEADRMERVMWRHSKRHWTVVTCLAVTEGELERPATLTLARAVMDGEPVG